MLEMNLAVCWVQWGETGGHRFAGSLKVKVRGAGCDLGVSAGVVPRDTVEGGLHGRQQAGWGAREGDAEGSVAMLLGDSSAEQEGTTCHCEGGEGLPGGVGQAAQLKGVLV